MAWGLIGAVVSAGLGMWGASKAQASQNAQIGKQYEYDMESWNYQNEAAERQIDFQREQNEVTRGNNLRNAMFQDQTTLQDWKHGLVMQDFKHGMDLTAKVKSDQELRQQLTYNADATAQAYERQGQWRHERELEKAFNIADQGIIQQEATDQLSAAYNEILLNKLSQNQQAKSAMVKTQANRNQSLEATAFESQNNQIDMLLAQGKAENTQAGRSQGKAIQSATAAGGRKEAELTQKAVNIFKLAAIDMGDHNQLLFQSNTQAAMARDKAGKNYINTYKRSAVEINKIKASYTSAMTQDAFAQMDIYLNKRQKDMDAYANNMVMPLQGPRPMPPFATPLPEILDPEDHVWSPEPIKGAAATGGVIAAAASALPGIATGISALYD